MNRYILLSWAAALGIVVTCGCTIERVAIFADFMAMLVILKIWQGEWLCRYKKPIAAIAMFVSVCVTIPAMDLNRENYNNYLYHCEQLENPNSFIIKTRQVADSRNLIGKWLRKRYVNPNVQYGFYCCYMAFDCHDFNSRAVAHLFNKDSIIMLPEDIVDKIERDSMAYSQWEADRDGKLYVWKLDSSQQVNHVIFMLGDEVPLRFYQRLVAYNGYEYELDSFNYEVITIKGCNYLVMTIPTTNIKRRIKEIIASPSSCEPFAAQ
jgi:hypothetical protein